MLAWSHSQDDTDRNEADFFFFFSFFFLRSWPRPSGSPGRLQGHLGHLLFQSGDSAVLEDDAVPERLELSEHLFQFVLHFLVRQRKRRLASLFSALNLTLNKLLKTFREKNWEKL